MIDRRHMMLRTGAALAGLGALGVGAQGMNEVVVLGEHEPQTALGAAAAAEQRMAPCSTFKIPMTLIALEEGLVEDPDALTDVDPRTFQPQPWWSREMRDGWGRPHSLRSAFAASAVWYFRRLALQLGQARMERYLALFEYGDGNISHGLDTFWNGGDRGLLISPNEQWRFLRRVAGQRFALREATYATAREVFVRERRPHAVLRAKTGLGWRGEARASELTGWFVGWVEQADSGQCLPFASLSVGRGDGVLRSRVDNAMAALCRAGAWREGCGPRRAA